MILAFLFLRLYLFLPLLKRPLNRIQIVTYQIQALETFVWNDRFSFFGGEPANQGIMNDAATQLAIGVQNSNVVQTLEHGATDNAAIYDVHVTFIDQDWT